MLFHILVVILFRELLPHLLAVVNELLDVGEWALPGGFLEVDKDKTIAHYALVKLAGVEANTDADKAEWFSWNDIPHLAFDHDKILRVAFSRLKQNIHFEPVGFELLPEVFTLPQLQNLYESILEVKLDRRNFANKMKHYEILTEVPGDSPRTAQERRSSIASTRRIMTGSRVMGSSWSSSR